MLPNVQNLNSILKFSFLRKCNTRCALFSIDMFSIDMSMETEPCNRGVHDDVNLR